MCAFDIRTAGQTEFSSLDHVCIRCSAVKDRQKQKSEKLYKNRDRSFFRFVTIHAFDRRTDGQTDTFLIDSLRWHSIQCGNKTVKELTHIARWSFVFEYRKGLDNGCSHGLFIVRRWPVLPTTGIITPPVSQLVQNSLSFKPDRYKQVSLFNPDTAFNAVYFPYAHKNSQYKKNDKNSKQ